MAESRGEREQRQTGIAVEEEEHSNREDKHSNREQEHSNDSPTTTNTLIKHSKQQQPID